MRLILVLGGILTAQIAICEPAGDAEQGRKLARQCQTCHGIDGYAKIPIAPHIGGEPAAYIARQLTSFRDGQRRHEMMTVVASRLDDQAITDLAAWYGAQTIEVALADGVVAGDAPELCANCHGADGIATHPEAPNLAGESTIYIETQLKAFRSGKRIYPDMNAVARELSDDDIREVSQWYAVTKFSVNP